MPSFGDSIFIFFLALLLFGPKKLPELARQLGKLMAEFRRASNEFRLQMEEELRISDQAERQKQLAALEAAAPAAAIMSVNDPPGELTAGPMTELTSESTTALTSESTSELTTGSALEPTEPHSYFPSADTGAEAGRTAAFEPWPDLTTEPATSSTETLVAATPLPIATSGDLSILPPSTGLPTPRSAPPASILEPAATEPAAPEPTATEESLHG
jgi:sec-independent protein translocase protein TatB